MLSLDSIRHYASIVNTTHLNTLLRTSPSYTTPPPPKRKAIFLFINLDWINLSQPEIEKSSVVW